MGNRNFLHIEVDLQFKEDTMAVAKKIDLTLSQYVRRAIREQIKRDKRKKTV